MKQTDPNFISQLSPSSSSQFESQSQSSNQSSDASSPQSSSQDNGMSFHLASSPDKVKKRIAKEYRGSIERKGAAVQQATPVNQNQSNQTSAQPFDALSGAGQSVNNSFNTGNQYSSAHKDIKKGLTQQTVKEQSGMKLHGDSKLSAQNGSINPSLNSTVSHQFAPMKKTKSSVNSRILVSKTSKAVHKHKKSGWKQRTWSGGQKKDDGLCSFQYLSESQRYLLPGDIVIHLDWFQDKTGFIANYDADEKPAIRIEYDKIYETIEMQLANNQPQLQCYDYLSRFLRSLEDPDAYDMGEKIMQHGANMRKIQLFNRKLYEQFRINFDERNDSFYNKSKQILIENYVNSICLFQIILINPQTLLPERMFDGVTKSCAQLFFGETFGGNITEYILRQGNLELFNHRMKISQKEFQMYNLNTNTKIEHNLSSNMYTSDNITFPVNIDYIIHPLDGDDKYRITEEMTNHHFMIVTRINIHPEVEENFIHLRASIPALEKQKSLKIKNLQYKIQSNMFIERFYPDISRNYSQKNKQSSITIFGPNGTSSLNASSNGGIQYGIGMGNPSPVLNLSLAKDKSGVKLINQKTKFQTIQIPLNDSLSTEI